MLFLPLTFLKQIWNPQSRLLGSSYWRGFLFYQVEFNSGLRASVHMSSGCSARTVGSYCFLEKERALPSVTARSPFSAQACWGCVGMWWSQNDVFCWAGLGWNEVCRLTLRVLAPLPELNRGILKEESGNFFWTFYFFTAWQGVRRKTVSKLVKSVWCFGLHWYSHASLNDQDSENSIVTWFFCINVNIRV